MKQKKSKRENLLSPSSSWRENPHPSRRTSSDSVPAVSHVGCLPGFFHLLFRFPSNRRKSLTLGLSLSLSTQIVGFSFPTVHLHGMMSSVNAGSKKREQITVVSASPAEINGNDRQSDVPPLPALTPPERYVRPPGEQETARKSLVGALEKCNRDLEELRRTIDVIKTTFFLQQKLPVPPSPTPVARDNSKVSDTVTLDSRHVHTQEPDKDIPSIIIKTGSNVGLVNRTIVPSRAATPRGPVVREVRRSMMESVNQACDDVSWGQRREIGRIGLALQHHICRDLIDDTVRELSFSLSDHFASPSAAAVCYDGDFHHRRRGSVSLPLDACRRRLVF